MKNIRVETPISTHVSRHTYGTRCIESGMRAVALQRLMKHTSISITLNTYTSIFNKYKLEKIEKVNIKKLIFQHFEDYSKSFKIA